MTANLIGVVYNTTSKVVRALIIPEAGDGLEDDNILAQQKSPPAGCAVATIQKSAVSNALMATVIAGVNAAQGLGLQAPSRCALVDKNGAVQDVVLADPVHTPTHNGFTVVQNAVGANKGDTYDGANFKRKYAIYSKTTGVVTSVQTVTLPSVPITTASQRLAVNNDNSLAVSSVVGVQLL
jgi:hypothetical protein